MNCPSHPKSSNCDSPLVSGGVCGRGPPARLRVNLSAGSERRTFAWLLAARSHDQDLPLVHDAGPLVRGHGSLPLRGHKSEASKPLRVSANLHPSGASAAEAAVATAAPCSWLRVTAVISEEAFPA